MRITLAACIPALEDRFSANGSSAVASKLVAFPADHELPAHPMVSGAKGGCEGGCGGHGGAPGGGGTAGGGEKGGGSCGGS